MDDIKGDDLTDLEEIPVNPSDPPQSPPLKQIGPESEVRGGPEAPVD